MSCRARIRRGSWAREAVALTLLLCGAAAATALASEAAAPESADRRSRERAILEALAVGGPAEPLVERYLADHVQRPRELFGASAPPSSELEASSSSLRELLVRGVSSSTPEGGLAPALARFEAARDRLLAHFEEVEVRLREAGIAGEVEARRAAALAAIRARFEPLGDATRRWAAALRVDEGEAPSVRSARIAAEGDPAVLVPLLDAAFGSPNGDPEVSKRPVLRSSTLPYGRRDLASRPPRVAPSVVPSYAQTAPAGPTGVDLAGSAEAPLSDEILLAAEALDHDPVRLFERVRNTVRYEPYAGALRGAEGTLRAGEGNDVDQSSLLVALLRASGIPARYVRGVVESPIGELESELRLTGAVAVLDALRRSGLPHRPVVRAGRVVAVELERTWVAAHVPYANYRGAVVDLSGATWIPLAPWSKREAGSTPTAVLSAMEFPAAAFVEEALASPAAALPLARIRSAVESHLAVASPGATYEEQLGAREIESQELGLLPSSLPFVVRAVTWEGAELDAGDVGRLRLRVRADATESGEAILDATFPISALAGRRVTLSYLPATVDDHRTILAWGGMSSVPAYLVHLRPVVRVAGRQAEVGEALPMGALHRLEVDFELPGERLDSFSQELVSGSYHALALGAPTVSPALDEGTDPADTERVAARLLSSLAYGYAGRWDDAEEELAALYDLLWLRPSPSAVFASCAVTVTTHFDLAWSLRFDGVTLDAALRAAEPRARGADAEAPRSALRLAGLHGSALEHALFEELFLVDGISADKGLALAAAGGIERLTIDATNVEQIVPTLDVAPEVRAAIRDWALGGMEVLAPRAEIQRNAWRGAVFRVEDPESGASGYFLSGGLAGGSTTEAPENWILQFLAAALAAPYTEPNLDPLAGHTIRKVEATDGQEGEVGLVFAQPLAVEVRDIFGAPVVEAIVTFLSFSGGGHFIDGEGADVTTITVATNSQGVASARFRAGTDTSVQPVFRLRYPGDEFVTRYGALVVEASVVTHGGDLPLPEAFSAFAHPGPVTHLARTNGSFDDFIDLPRLASWSDTILVQARDRFENPVSNVGIDAHVVMGSTTPPECLNPAFDPLPAAVFTRDLCSVPIPLLGECGGDTAHVKASAQGGSIGVIGPSEIRSFDVELLAEATPLARQRYGIIYGFVGPEEGVCSPLIGGTEIRSAKLVDEFGNNVQAARPGGFYGPLQFEILLFDEYLGGLCTNCIPCGQPMSGCYPPVPSPGGGVWRRGIDATLQEYAFEVDLLVSSGGVASDPLTNGPAMFEAAITTGSAPAEDVVGADAELLLNICPQILCEGYPGIVHWFHHTERVTEVWSVVPRILGVTPDPIPLDALGRTEQATAIQYAIEPANYHARSVEVVLLADGEEIASGHGTVRQGAGMLSIQRGFEIDSEKLYEAQVVLNRGSAAEVRSDPYPLPLSQRLFSEVDESVTVSQEVDPPNRRICEQPDSFHFFLSRSALVTLELYGVQALAGGGYADDGGHVVLLSNETLDEGPHDIAVTPADLPPGRYRYVLRGEALGDAALDVREGMALSQYRSRDSLPIGHEFVKGVDLFDGHLTLTRQDFSVPGRGGEALSLSFSRTYSSESGGEIGSLGVGWSMNWGSKVLVTPCGEAIVVGGEGTGMRFVDDGNGGLRPLKGYHGSLVANPDFSFDFFAKGGNRYHYLRTTGPEWELDRVVDPNGNTLRLLYEPSLEPDRRRVSGVVDASGRTLRFLWEVRDFAQERAEVIRRVEGPLGLALDLDYDAFGNLVRAAREPYAGGVPSAVESYRYEIQPLAAFDDQHVLVEAKDEIRNASTLYAWQRGTIGLPGGLSTPRAFVSSLTEPEGGTTGFAFDLAALEVLADGVELEVHVTDPRDQFWSYRVNGYGSLVRRLDPLGHEISQTWSLDDVVPTSRIDENGVTTLFTHDAHGNRTSEAIAVTDIDGVERAYVSSWTFEPPAAFDPPYIKNRPATSTDRNGVTRRFDYDARGNLIGEEIDVTDADGAMTTIRTDRLYFENGDLRTLVNGRRFSTTFAYDAYGNPNLVIDARGARTSRLFDARSRLVTEIDARQNTTTFGYDTLDRRIRVIYPEVDGVVAEERSIYEDSDRRVVAIDAEENSTITTYDRQGRVASVENAAGGSKAFEYDEDGNKTLESSWFDASTPRNDTEYVYDAAGRLAERNEPLGRRTVYDYDAAGNVVRETVSDSEDPEFVPRVTESDYDELDRRIEERRRVGADWARRQFLLDGEGRTIAEDDPLERRRVFRHDELGRRIEAIEPEWRAGEPRVTRWFYDGNGNRLREVRLNQASDGGGGFTAANQTRRWVFDEVDRPRELHDAEEKVTVREYDAVGNLTREISPRLVVTEHDYDERNRVESTRLLLGRFSSPERTVETTLRYDRNGNLVERILPNGNVVASAYDALNRLVSESDGLGTLATYDYDARGNVTRSTDGRGAVTISRYDALDRLVEQDLPEDRHPSWSWDVAGNRLAETNARGFVTTFSYDGLDRLVEVHDPEEVGTFRAYTYDLAGNRRTERNRRDLTTKFDYDALDRLTRIVDPAPLGFERTFVYDAVGNLLAETDRRGIATTYRYDRENRRTSTRRAGIELERVEYDEAGNRRFLTDANLNVTGFVWDERNLLLRENRPLVSFTKHAYDDMGDRISTIDPENHETTFAYDARRRLIASTNELDETTVYCHDGNGNRTAERRPKFALPSDPCGTAAGLVRFEFDGANRLTAVVDPLDNRTEYDYDESGNRIRQRDANLRETTFTFDALDRLESKTYPGGDVESYGYDENGNRDRLTDPKGQVFFFGYDALDRLTSETLPVPSPPTGDELLTRTTTYDANGNVLGRLETYSTSGDAQFSSTWDDFDRRLTATNRFGELISFTYDPNGNRRTVRDSDGVVTTYTYDALNRLATQVGSGGVTSFDYFRNGLLKKRTNPNGSSATHAYDGALRTVSIQNRQHAAIVSSYQYEYDDNGNRTRQVEINGGAPEETTYTYDAADRLIGVAYPDEAVHYTLDGVGNRLTETVVDVAGGTMTSAKALDYDARDRLLSIADPVAPENAATFTWDLNGNQTGRTRGGVSRRHLYDALDRLVEVEEAGTFLERYAYDPDGYRIRKSGPEGVFRYVRDESAILQQTDDAGNTIARYEWGGGGLVAMNHVTEGRRFSLFDGLGSVTGWSRQDGGVGLRRSFDAWGQVRTESGDTEAPFAFTGYEFDEATGAYYAKARYYDPEIGRFLNEDPFGGMADTPPSLHRFLYAHGNPTLFVDPSGMCVWGLPCPEIVEKAIDKTKEAVAVAAEELVTVVAKRVAGVAVAIQKDEIPLPQAALEEGIEVAKQGVQMTASALRGDVAGMMDQRAEFLEKQSAKAKAEVEALPVVRVAAGQATMVGSALGGDLEGTVRQGVRTYADSMEDMALIAGTAIAAPRGAVPARSAPARVRSATVGESAATGGAEVAEVATTRSVPTTEAPKPVIDKAYKRPSGATTPAQREAVQGQPCVHCGTETPRQVAGHKKALVEEYYETGAIDKQRMRSLDAVQSECPTCSAEEGARMSQYSKQMKKELKLE